MGMTLSLKQRIYKDTIIEITWLCYMQLQEELAYLCCRHQIYRQDGHAKLSPHHIRFVTLRKRVDNALCEWKCSDIEGHNIAIHVNNVTTLRKRY
jgi:hypothetical protein